jgi:hypothetical protein
MSDFIFSSTPINNGRLSSFIRSIYHSEPPEIFEYHGKWGSLAVSRNLYNGFQPLETDESVIVVVGGPVLGFIDNDFLTASKPTAGTKAISERMQSGEIQWDEDLSGPFVILKVEKKTGRVLCITDLMMFIPVYQYCHDNMLMLGTHVDCMAKASGEDRTIDGVSVADFILHDVVTYPYTLYEKIQQIRPASVHSFELSGNDMQEKSKEYWWPEEKFGYKTINEAADVVREGLRDFTERVANNMSEVAHFISAGEDSRVVAGLLPKNIERKGYIFLDSMNREGRIAQKAAEAYNAKFCPVLRDEMYYLDILPAASDLIGSCHFYTHTHSLWFHISCGLDNYQAVFGGFLSDTLLKGHHIKKYKLHGQLPFLPQGNSRRVPSFNSTDSKAVSVMKPNVYQKVLKRRAEHMKWIQSFRPSTYSEWFHIWPISMHNDISYFYSNRRLFRCYEPFMCKQVVKIGASVPTNWKLNRRLFNKSVRPFLEQSRYLFHASGFLPYFPWWINVPVHFGVWVIRRIGKKTGIIRGNQGPWGSRQKIMTSETWKEYVKKYSTGVDFFRSTFTKPARQLIKTDDLNRVQKMKLLQLLYRMDGYQ